MGGGLPRGLVALLLAGAHEDAAAARGGDRPADEQPDQGAAAVRHYAPPGKGAPAARRLVPPQAAIGTPARPGARERLELLAALCLGDGLQARRAAERARPPAVAQGGDRQPPQRQILPRPVADAGGGRRRRNARLAHQDHRRHRRGRAHQEGRRTDWRGAGGIRIRCTVAKKRTRAAMRNALVFMLAALLRIGRSQIATFLGNSTTNYALHFSRVLSPAGPALLETESIADGVD